MIKSQATTTERSQVYVSQQYRWHMMIGVEWEDLRQKNSPHDIFTRLSYYFQLSLDETSFICNESEIKVIGIKDNPNHQTFYSNSRFSITVLQIGSAAVVNGPVIFLAKGTKTHPRLRVTKLVNR